MKRALPLALASLLTLTACGSARTPTSIDDLMALTTCHTGWKIVQAGAIVGCADPKVGIGYERGGYSSEYLIAFAKDDAELDGCWLATDRKNWMIQTCDSGVASAANREFGGEVIDL